jgi:hypothetical protein
VLGLEVATKGDNVFRALVLARIIEPTGKIDAARVLTEVGVEGGLLCHPQARRLPSYAQPSWRQSLAAASARHAGLGPASLVFSTSRRLPRRERVDLPGFDGWADRRRVQSQRDPSRFRQGGCTSKDPPLYLPSPEHPTAHFRRPRRRCRRSRSLAAPRRFAPRSARRPDDGRSR